MQPIFHFIAAGAVTAAASPLVSFTEGTGIFLAAFFLDIDHYADYVFRFRDLHPWRAVRHFYAHLDTPRHYLGALHTLEFVGALGILALLTSSRVAAAIFMGVLAHWALDLIHGIYMGQLSSRFWTLAGYLMMDS